MESSIVKVIEVIADSDKSWEDAAEQALAHASKTIRNIRSIYVKESQALVSNNKITRFRINAMISFVVDD
jgi:flavin-binding protein dodecin